MSLHGKRIDLKDRQFGRWTVIEYSHSVSPSQRPSTGSGLAIFWKCKCSCGEVGVVRGTSLRSGKSASCGCLGRDRRADSRRTHGMSCRPEYYIWKAMCQRCQNPNDKAFDRYGGRGIKVCESWKKFANFFSDMGPKPEGRSLDRINNNGNYEPVNCRWATYLEQSNNKRNNRRHPYGTELVTVGEICRRLGLKTQLISDRVYRGRTLLEAVEMGINIRLKNKLKHKEAK